MDSKPGEKATNGANGANGDVAAVLARRRRSSSLMMAATSLPTVEHSLEEFIAKANQTLVDVNTWKGAETHAREEDEKRKEQDAQRWKQAEVQLRESDAREQSLRRQLDGLQGKLAEAEARAAVAMSASSSNVSPAQTAANDATITELKSQIESMTQRMRESEEQSKRMSVDLTAARDELRMSRAMPAVSVVDDEDASERVRLAEAKAAKALAAARAAAAGLTVSPADLAAIESGLVVVEPPRRASPVLPVTIAFIGGIAIMFAVWKLALNKDDRPVATTAPAPAAAPAQVQPSAQPPAPPPAEPIKPTVTPIDDQAATPQPQPIDTKAAAPEVKPGPTVTPIEEPAPAQVKAAPAPAPAEVKAAPAPAQVKAAPAPAPAEVKTAKPATRPVTKPATKPAVKPAGGIADPFAETPAAAPAKKTEKKPEKKDKKPAAGGLVDPF